MMRKGNFRCMRCDCKFKESYGRWETYKRVKCRVCKPCRDKIVNERIKRSGKILRSKLEKASLSKKNLNDFKKWLEKQK